MEIPEKIKEILYSLALKHGEEGVRIPESQFDNLIKLLQQKEQVKTYSKEEVRKLLQNCAINFGVVFIPEDDGGIPKEIDKWIDKNL